MIEYRALKQGEEKEVLTIIEKAYGFVPMPHFRWKTMDNPLWKYEYAIVGETEGRIAAVEFFVPLTMKFLDKTLEVMVGGSGAVPEEFRRRGYYTRLTASAVDMVHRLRKAMLIVYVDQRVFTYPSLKKMGFYPLFYQKKYIKILSVKKVFAMAAEKLNKTRQLTSSLTVRIVPQCEEPFVLAVKEGQVSLEKDTPGCDLVIAGNIKKMVALLVGSNYRRIVYLFLKREISVRFRIKSLGKILKMAKEVIF